MQNDNGNNMAETSLISSTLMAALSGLMISTLGTTTLTSAETTSPTGETRFRLLSDAEAWRLLPLATNGAGHPLPTWARMLASELPRTAAALLQLDLAQRTKSPVEPELRAAMRWVAAHANHCIYAEADAAADALRAGVSPSRIEALGQAGYPGWSESEQKGLAFAR